MGSIRAARRFAWRYYGAMLSAAAVAAVLGTGSAYTSGNTALLPDLLAWIAVLLAGVNLAGAALLYRPIRRHVAGDETVGAALERRARALPVLSGLWVFALTAASMLGYAAVARGSWESLVHGPIGTLLGTLTHCFVFAVYLGVLVYLLVLDHLISVRKALWKLGRPLALPRRRFAGRLVGALIAVALGPVLIALSDQWGHPLAHAMGEGMAVAPDHPGRFLHQTLQMDVLAALLLSVALAILVARGVARPVEILLDAMGRVDDGDLATKAPVVTDDEFGMLTSRFNRMLDGLSAHERMRRTFAQFVPESVAGALLAEEGAIAPQEREASILFVDIESFTRIAAGLGPQGVMVLLNGYFGEVAEIIHRRAGVITQFQGDAVLASFNLPALDPGHAGHALDAALEIQRRLAEVTFHGGVRLRARAGICTGPVVGGTVGGGERLGYTVHGDTVNLAARLEALNKQLGTRILLSARTAALLPDATALRDCGLIEVSGFEAPIRVFEAVGARPEEYSCGS